MFEEANWTRLDFWAIVAGHGLVTVALVDLQRCRDWLRENHYEVTTLAFGNGIGPAVLNLGVLLEWENQFGYSLSADSRNLNALRDGFLESAFVSQGRVVLELGGIDQALIEDPAWTQGFLEIAQEASLIELALGRHFFCTLLVKDRTSPLIGTALGSLTVGSPFQFRNTGYSHERCRTSA